MHVIPIQTGPTSPSRGLLAAANILPLLPIVTLVLWFTCATVGIAGFLIPQTFSRRSAVIATPPVTAQLVKIEPPKIEPPKLVPLPPPEPTPLDLAAPPDPSAIALPDTPAPIPVAAPSPAISFAVPVEGYTRIVDASQAAHGRPQRIATAAVVSSTGHGPPTAPPRPAPPAAAPAPPPIQRLTFGQGEGNQPAPDYPRDAVLARQQGTVSIRLTVDETGTVTSAEIASPSHWPLLNQAALRTVRDRWHFPPGKPRLYLVPIEFQLQE